jgi:prolyl-tRNA synthetase
MPKVEAVEESEKMMNVYADFAKLYGNSGCKGIKTETERFVAEETYCIEALMQDGKALQSNVPLFRSKFC